MSKKTRKEIEVECLDKLLIHYGYYSDLVNFLMEEKLMTNADVENLKVDADRPKYLYELLKNHQKNDRLMLLSFEWAMLPEERIVLTLVTTTCVRTFKHNY